MASSGSFKTTAHDGRYLLFSWSVSRQDVANNSTIISWNLKGAGTASVGYYKAGAFKVVIDGKTVYSSTTRINLYDGTQVASGTFTLAHKSDGSRGFSASAQGAIYTTAVNSTGSGTFTLPTIPRASTINSVSGGKVTDLFSVKFTRYASSFTDTLQIGISDGPVVQKIANYSSGTKFELSDSMKSAIYSASQSAQSATVAFQLVTYNGSVKVGSSNTITKSVTVNDSQPSIGGIAYSDTNATTAAITGDATKVIRNHSTVNVTVSDLSAVNGATLASLNVKAGAFSQDIALSGSSMANKVVAVGTLDLAADTVLVATLTDSRGNTATASVNLTVLDYENPTANITCKRRNNFYTETDLTVNPLISYLDGKNSATITAYTKEKGASTYGSAVSVESGTATVLSLDNTKAWNVKVVVADKLSSMAYVLYIEKGQPIIFFDRVLNSVGVGCFPKDSNSFEVIGKNIYNALFYNPGDSVTVKNVYACGTVTSGSSALDFSVTLPKSLENIGSITISELKISARNAGGGYTLSDAYVSGGYDVLADSNITVTYSLKTGTNAIAIYLDTKSKYNGANNTPQSIQIHSLKFTCN